MGLLIDYVAPFVLILSLLVFVHEFGHYWVARRNGVTVEVFSIGFGPELFGRTDRSGTRWRVAAIPLGGYVKMKGDADPSSARPGEQAGAPDAFHTQSVGARAAIAAAGPAANYALAILLLAGLYMVEGQRVTPPAIDVVAPDSPAAAAGLRPGDVVRDVDGVRIERFEDLQRYVQVRPEQPMRLTLSRDGGTVTLDVAPAARVLVDRFGGEHRVGMLGVQSRRTEIKQLGPIDAVGAAVVEAWELTVGTLHAAGQMLAGVRDASEIGGVLRMAQMSGEVTRDGAANTVLLIALLSLNLGLINLLPIPVLDGGHLLFYAAEAVRGRPLSPRAQEVGVRIGLAAVAGLMLLATWNDLVHFKVVRFLTSLAG